MIPFNSHITNEEVKNINDFLESATDDTGLVHESAKLPIRTIGSYHVVLSVFHTSGHDFLGNKETPTTSKSSTTGG